MKLVNADDSDRVLQQETENMPVDKENFDASLINASIIDEIDIRIEELEENRPLTHGDGALASLLENAKNELHNSASIEQTNNALFNTIASLKNINSRFVPRVKQNLLKLLSFLSYKYKPESRVGNKIVIANTIKDIFGQIADPRREDNTYQSSPIGGAAGENAFENKIPDDKTMTLNEEPPKVEQESTSMNPLVDINNHVHELDDLINRAVEKATMLQHKSVEYNGANTQSKIELVNTISTLLRRLQIVQKLTSVVSYNVNKKLKTKI